MRYAYPARFEKHRDTCLVFFRDLPEAVTEGGDREAALVEAVSCLDAALLFRLKEEADIPPPSAPGRGEQMIAASPSVAAKTAFIRAFRMSGLSRVALAERLKLQETEVRRMLDPAHGTKLDRLDAGMRALGRRLVVADMEADAA